MRARALSGAQNMQHSRHGTLRTPRSQEKMTADLDATFSSVTCPPLPPSLSHLATLRALIGARCQVFRFLEFCVDPNVMIFTEMSIKLANVSLI